MTTPQITTDTTETGTILRLTGSLVTDALASVERDFAGLTITTDRVVVDMSGLEALDTAGASMIAGLRSRLAKTGTTLTFERAPPERLHLIEKVAAATFPEKSQDDTRRGLAAHLERLGKAMAANGKAVQSFVGFLGLVVTRLGYTLLRPWRLRGAALVTQMQQTGYNAVPIVALMGFLIGIVLAYQGAAQLQQFGAEVFVVDLIAVSVLRELGILLTAIIVAGRSGSAYAAAIGSMKINQEIDAMRTLGLDPIDVLVLPRMIALIVMLPVLGLIANIAALFGGGLMSWIELGVSPDMFITRFRDGTDVWHLLVGMIKAPVFAFIIALVACWQGLQVAASADSVGLRTRTSVVQAIFLVIVMDAIFSIFFAELGV